MSKKSNQPGNYQYSDQFARLEAARAYVQAAGEILDEAQNYERRSSEPTFVLRGIRCLKDQLKNSYGTLNTLMGDMQCDLAVEGGQKNTIPPLATEPDPFLTVRKSDFPLDLSSEDLDEPFDNLEK